MNQQKVLKWILLSGSKEYELLFDQPQPLEVHELQECIVSVVVKDGFRPHLTLGDYALTLTPLNSEDGLTYYTTDKLKFFQNFIGITHLELNFKEDSRKITSTAISVFARKATCDRAVAFLRMISEKSDVSALCFSITNMSSNASKSTKNISVMLNTGIKALQYFKEQQSRFTLQPCSTVKLQNTLQAYNNSIPIDDRSITYLCTNPESLSRCSPESTDIMVNGRSYEISRIQTTSHQRDTNVFENKVILAFVKNFLAYLKEVKRNLHKQRIAGKDAITFDGSSYLSIDRVFENSGLILDIHKSSIETAIADSMRCIAFIQKHLPCDGDVIHGTSVMPIPTQNVLARTHYLKMFGLIKLYYDIGEPQWRGQLEFYGLRNLYKIYEFVCLINIIETFANDGYITEEALFKDRNGSALVRPINEPCNYYKFRREDVVVELFYEPHALLASKVESTTQAGTLIDVYHTNSQTWSPDFVLRVNTGGQISTHIIDAKYSNFNSVRTYHLENCVVKYTTKMMVFNDQTFQPVDSMHLLYSGDHYKYETYYTDHLGLYAGGKRNHNALKPIIGAISHNENNFGVLSQLLKDIVR